jgi:hypothetical protein
MKLTLIATSLLFLLSTSALAARVESEEAQTYGAKANVVRTVVGAVSAPDTDTRNIG